MRLPQRPRTEKHWSIYFSQQNRLSSSPPFSALNPLICPSSSFMRSSSAFTSSSSFLSASAAVPSNFWVMFIFILS